MAYFFPREVTQVNYFYANKKILNQHAFCIRFAFQILKSTSVSCFYEALSLFPPIFFFLLL